MCVVCCVVITRVVLQRKQIQIKVGKRARGGPIYFLSSPWPTLTHAHTQSHWCHTSRTCSCANVTHRICKYDDVLFLRGMRGWWFRQVFLLLSPSSPLFLPAFLTPTERSEMHVQWSMGHRRWGGRPTRSMMARQWRVPRSLQRWPSCLCLGCFATCFHKRVQEVIVEDVPASSFAKLQGRGAVLFLLPPSPAVPAPHQLSVSGGFRFLGF